MKLNVILTIIFIALVGLTFLMFIGEEPSDPRLNYLMNPISERSWSLEIKNGVLSRSGDQFLWNDKLIPSKDENLPKVLEKIGDFKIIRKINDIKWTNEMQQESFAYNKKKYAISELNKLTGRFMIFDKQLREIYLVEDQAPLQELHKSFEAGQEIKYYNFLTLVKNHIWDL